ncbi:MAG TPA: dihydrolipoamide acetyltransferase family protein [Thermoplasmata archaeon]|nr:dihydrolipoamide acetyltransferase family protein [Thermoplasmata archaeon]
MAFEFKLPDIGEGVAEGEVVKWYVKEGDAIAEDAPLVSVLTDKANVEIPSPRAGRISKIHAQEGQKVKVGGLLVTIETAGDSGGKSGAPPPSEPPAESTVSVGQAPSPGEPSPPPASAPTPTEPAPPSSAPAGRVLAAPYLRRLAAEKGVDLGAVRGTGPNGRITEADVLAAAAGGAAPPPAPATVPAASPAVPPPEAPAPSPPTAPAPASASAPVPAGAEIERVPIRGLRRVIAEHMAEAMRRAAHFTYVEEVDATELVRTRDRMAKHLEKQGTRLTYLPFVIKGVVAGLRQYPMMNATMDDDKQELVVHHRYHLGIATATPDGLIVPVIRDANTKSVGQLARELYDLSERGRSGKLTRGELSGSTFTITSLGALGGVLATPILNYPEVAILGVHRIVKRPVYAPDGTLRPADLMNLSVSLDHRVLDGITGAQFLAVVKANLEDPHLMFSELA